MQELDEMLARSSATEAFKAQVRTFYEDAGYRVGPDLSRIHVRGYAPPVKVKRLLKQMLATETELPVERVVITGTSGCSDFAGSVEVATADGTHRIDFVWDCRWRAEREGWTDYFGFPDQSRAAREFDWQCFHTWQRKRIGN